MKDNKSRQYLVFVKLVGPNEEKMHLKGVLFFHLDHPIDIKKIQRIAGLSDEDINNFDLFIEPYSNQVLRHQIDIENRAGQFK